ncbi:DUF317 domain-containing protein [Streptomyces diacarni]|uniref:DUF317 domain-containing protein n=1 Tax=Streptomyces diacarni TaxID=2800381 RepID=UPI0033E460E5
MPPDDPSTIDGDIWVRPRYLAGSTAIGDPALDPLLNLGWTLEHDDLANVYLSAPDRTIRLGYLPEGEDDGLWRINAYKDPFATPTWGVCFNDSCPTEVVTAFTTALATAYQQGPHAYLAAPDPSNTDQDPIHALSPLIKRGWTLNRPRGGVLALQAPDRLASCELTMKDLDPEDELTSRTARWHLWAGASIDAYAWYATASSDTPVGLVTAITACVSDPAPLPRWSQETHSYVQGLAQLTPARPPNPPAPTPLDVRRAARPTTLPARSIPRWSTTTPRPAAPGPRH